MSRPRVVVVRGHSANPWELGAWEPLAGRFDVRFLLTERNAYDVSAVAVTPTRIRALRDMLPGGRAGDLAVHLPGDRYLGLRAALEGAEIVHAAETGSWFSAQVARLKPAVGFSLALTVWETIPFVERFLDPVRARRFGAARRVTVDAADLFLAATERARQTLLLEGVPAERVIVSPPGVDIGRFGAARAAEPAGYHLIVSPGRLVWEKGHYDVIRAIAHLGGSHRLLIVGAGKERARMLDYAARLGVADRVVIRGVPYTEMPATFASASAVVLASLSIPGWEEQFGMVLAEALAAGAPIVASASGAIPEVLERTGARLFAPGDWLGLARALADGPLAGPSPSARVPYDTELIERYSVAAAAARLAEAYDRLVAARRRASLA